MIEEAFNRAGEFRRRVELHRFPLPFPFSRFWGWGRCRARGHIENIARSVNQPPRLSSQHVRGDPSGTARHFRRIASTLRRFDHRHLL